MYTVFLVDDEPIVLDMLKSSPAFLECGFEVIGLCADPVLAIDRICEAAPDVIFTDLKMPVISGVTMLARIKSKGVQSEAVIISAYGEFTEARHFFTNGGFDYLLKPVSEHELTALLEKLSAALGKKNKSVQTTLQSLSPELNVILEYLEENVTDKHSLESLSQRFNLNPNYICNLFSRHLNTTFIAYITSLRMKEAGQLLRETALSVKEIAPLCGYSDYFYFCRVFREQYRCTPTSYREGGR